MARLSDTAYHPLDKTPYDARDGYNGNHSIRRFGSRKTIWSEDLLKEWVKCRDDIEYFAANYCKVLHPDRGMVNFEPYPYQRDMWKLMQTSRFSIILACRQSGKTAGVTIELVHEIIFFSDKTTAVVAHKASQAAEIMARIRTILENLPFFLQPEVKYYNKGSVEFGNNSRIFAAASGSSTLRGKSLTHLYLDEFAFVMNDDEFMAGTYPVVTAGKTAKITITSTANGVGNAFHKIWTAAVEKKNAYGCMRVDWWDVPGRDAKWKAETIANTSQRQFDQEFGNEFMSTGNMLISGAGLESLRAEVPMYEQDNVKVFKKPKQVAKRDNYDGIYVMTVDVCKGRGQDYSTFTIFDVTHAPFEQVCVFRDSMISPMVLPDVVTKWARAYNNAFVIVESNDEGAAVARTIFHDLEYENIYVGNYRDLNRIGVEVDRKVKHLGTSRLKDMIETMQLKVVDIETISELYTFERKGNSWAAKEGKHDDLVANLWMFAYIAGTEIFQEVVGGENLRERLFAEKSRAIEESVPFPGFFEEDSPRFSGDNGGGTFWGGVY